MNSTNFLIPSQRIATLGILEDIPIVSVAATASPAYQGGSPGQFTITRSGGLETNLNIRLYVGGTAVAGTDYVAIPTNITLERASPPPIWPSPSSPPPPSLPPKR